MVGAQMVDDQWLTPPPRWLLIDALVLAADWSTQIEYLVQEGGIKVLGELLKQSSMVMMALEGLERILQVRSRERAEHDFMFRFCFVCVSFFRAVASPLLNQVISNPIYSLSPPFFGVSRWAIRRRIDSWSEKL